MTIEEAARALRERRVTATQLTREALDRIERLNPKLNAFLTVTAEGALEQAQTADRERNAGTDRGPLHGIPIAHKDLFFTRGVRTTAGSKLYEDFIPDHDAAVVERLGAAGAVSLGKLNMHELAFGITSTNPHFGPVRNPWNPEHIPGGSSGGSGAAVAANLVFAATGSDTGGSIRIPASFCGVVGLKPTYGRVSRFGAFPLSFALDHMGPFARTVRDTALVLQTMAGYDRRDPSSVRNPVPEYLPEPACSIRGLRIGLPEEYFFQGLDPEVDHAVRSSAERARELGALVEPVRLPDLAALNAAGMVIQYSEFAALMERHRAERDRFGADVLALLDLGRLLPASDYVNAQRVRRRAQSDFGRIWQQVDCLLMPTTPVAAPKIGAATVLVQDREEDLRPVVTRLVRCFNSLGWPVLSIPCGMTASGLPVGLQIVGAPFQEAVILRVGAALEEVSAAIKAKPLF